MHFKIKHFKERIRLLEFCPQIPHVKYAPSLRSCATELATCRLKYFVGRLALTHSKPRLHWRAGSALPSRRRRIDSPEETQREPEAAWDWG